MKKRLVALGLVSGAMIAAAAMTSMAAEVTEANAKDIAMNHAGVSAENVAYIISKPDFEHGMKVFDVEFITKDYKEYDYEIKADDGTIISYDYDAERKFYTDIPEEKRNSDITSEKAKEIALSHAGKTAEEVTFVKVKSDYDDGMHLYEVEFYAGDYTEYDYEISAYTGEIISYDYDAENYYRNTSNGASSAGGNYREGRKYRDNGFENGNNLNTEASVSEAEAKAKALSQAGLSESDVSNFIIYKDYEDGRMVYKGKFYQGMLEYEFEVDANSGMITDRDVESIYD